MILPLSAATGNLLWHSLTENLFRVAMLSWLTPITDAPSAWYCGMAAAKSWASTVQPLVKAAG